MNPSFANHILVITIKQQVYYRFYQMTRENNTDLRMQYTPDGLVWKHQSLFLSYVSTFSVSLPANFKRNLCQKNKIIIFKILTKKRGIFRQHNRYSTFSTLKCQKLPFRLKQTKVRPFPIHTDLPQVASSALKPADVHTQ